MLKTYIAQRDNGIQWTLTPFICHPVLLIVHLLSFILAMCPAHFHFALVTYWTVSVTLVLHLIMVLRTLSFSLTLSIFLSMDCWLVSSFFTNDFVRGHVSHPLLVRHTGEKSSLLDSWEVPVQKDFSILPKSTPSCFYSQRNFWLCSGFHCYYLAQIFIISHLKKERISTPQQLAMGLPQGFPPPPPLPPVPSPLQCLHKGTGGSEQQWFKPGAYACGRRVSLQNK